MEANGVMTLSNIFDAIQMIHLRPDSLTGQQTHSFLNIDAHKDDDPPTVSGATGSAPAFQADLYDENSFVHGEWWDSENQC